VRLKVRDPAARLPEREHLELTYAVAGCLHDARLAGRCRTDPDPQSGDAIQLLDYFGRSIQQPEAARAILRTKEYAP
jgi:hypothetical protein